MGARRPLGPRCICREYPQCLQERDLRSTRNNNPTGPLISKVRLSTPPSWLKGRHKLLLWSYFTWGGKSSVNILRAKQIYRSEWLSRVND